MAEPVVVTIPHKLGKEEAARRLKKGFGDVRATFGEKFVVLRTIAGAATASTFARACSARPRPARSMSATRASASRCRLLGCSHCSPTRRRRSCTRQSQAMLGRTRQEEVGLGDFDDLGIGRALACTTSPICLPRSACATGDT